MDEPLLAETAEAFLDGAARAARAAAALHIHRQTHTTGWRGSAPSPVSISPTGRTGCLLHASLEAARLSR